MIRKRPLPISAPPSNVDVRRRPPPPPEVYDWATDDPELVECRLDNWLTPDAPWLTTELGEPT